MYVKIWAIFFSNQNANPKVFKATTDLHKFVHYILDAISGWPHSG